MSEPIRWVKGTRVRWQKQGQRARVGVLTVDCAEWHSFATVKLDRDREECSVWAGDIQPVEVAR